MSAWTNFQTIRVPASAPPLVKPRLSATSDILSFRRCRRQYGYFGNDGFVPAQTVQVFFGTIIHQVLDRVHRHYAGLTPGIPQGTFPTDQDIDQYFTGVENALRAHGIRPLNSAMRDKSLRVIQAFNRIEGPMLYPRVFDTEYRLEAEQPDFILRGVVDVLADDSAQGPADREIWDYKGTKRPPNSSQELQNYEFQMCVYAQLYHAKTGVYPARAILYFVNELDSDPPLNRRPVRAVYQVNFTPQLIQQAMAAFDQTAQDISACKQAQRWDAPTHTPGQETCDVCDIRWNCPSVSYQRRYPI